MHVHTTHTTKKKGARHSSTSLKSSRNISHEIKQSVRTAKIASLTAALTETTRRRLQREEVSPMQPAARQGDGKRDKTTFTSNVSLRKTRCWPTTRVQKDSSLSPPLLSNTTLMIIRVLKSFAYAINVESQSVSITFKILLKTRITSIDLFPYRVILKRCSATRKNCQVGTQ